MRQLLVVLVGVTYLKEMESSYIQMVWNVHILVLLKCSIDLHIVNRVVLANEVSFVHDVGGTGGWGVFGCNVEVF